MLAGFEMWVRKADEDGGELVSGEEIGEEFHSVGTKGGDVLVRCRQSWRCGGRPRRGGSVKGRRADLYLEF